MAHFLPYNFSKVLHLIFMSKNHTTYFIFVLNESYGKCALIYLELGNSC